jgi:hypothetical protein
MPKLKPKTNSYKLLSNSSNKKSSISKKLHSKKWKQKPNNPLLSKINPSKNNAPPNDSPPT